MLGCALATPCPRDQVQMVYDVTTHLLLPDGSEQHGGNTSGHVYTGESLHQPLGLLSSGETKLVSDSTYAVRVRVWSGTRGGPRPDVLPALSSRTTASYEAGSVKNFLQSVTIFLTLPGRFTTYRQ